MEDHVLTLNGETIVTNIVKQDCHYLIVNAVIMGTL